MLADLKADYLIALPAKLERLTNLVHGEKWDLLHTEFHKLKGTGKTYGIPEVSELCETGEELSSGTGGQNRLLFLDIIQLLEKVRIAYEEQAPFQWQDDPLSQALLKKVKDL